MLVEIRSPELEVGQINLLDLLFRKRLTIRTLQLNSPTITLLQDSRAQQEASTDTKQSNPLPSFLESVHIADLHIPDATIRHISRNERPLPQNLLPQLSLRVLELELKELDQPDYTRMFAADDVHLSFSNYAYQSPDGVYSGHIGQFSYSSKQGALAIDDILLRGDNSANLARGPEEASPLIVDLSAPRLRISGMDLLEAYTKKELLVEEISLEGLALQLLENPQLSATSAEAPTPDRLWASVSPWLRVLDIGEFRLQQASLKLSSQLGGEAVPLHTLRQLDIALQGIHLDSASLFAPREKVPLAGFRLAARDYAYQHPLSPYQVSAGRLTLSSQEQQLQLDSLRVLGDWQKNRSLIQQQQARSMLLSLDVPHLLMSELDLISAFQQSRLAIGRLALTNPSLDLMEDPSVPPSDPATSSEQLYRTLSPYLTELQVAEIDLQNLFFTQHHKAGSGAVTQVQRLDRGSLQLQGLRLDSSFLFSDRPGLPLQALRLAADGYRYRTPDSVQTFRLEQLRYASSEQVLHARSISIRSNQRANARQQTQGDAQPTLVDLRARRFQLTGLDVITSLNTGRLAVDQIILSQPDLALLKDRDAGSGEQDQRPDESLDLLFSIFNTISVKAIHLQEGSFAFREKRKNVVRTQRLEELSATLTGLQLSPEILNRLDEQAPLQEIRFAASDYTYRSPDSLYTIRLDSLQYSSLQQQLTARSFTLGFDQEIHAQRKARSLADAPRNLFDVEASKLLISGFDIVQAYNSGRYQIEDMLLSAPQLRIVQDRTVLRRQQAVANAAAGGADAKNKQEPPAGQASEQDSTASETLEQLAEYVETFRVGRLRVEDGSLDFQILEDTLQRSQQIEHLSLVLDQLRLVSLSSSDPLEMFTLDDLGLLIRNYRLLTADSLYQLHIGEIRSSLGSQSLTLDSLQVVPLYGEDEFQEKLEYSTDRIQLAIPSIGLAGIDLDALYNDQELLARRLQINSPKARLYRDNRLERDPERRPPTLQKMLRDIPFRVVIDSLQVQDALIRYAEVAPTGVEPGVLSLENTRLAFQNVTNDSLRIRQNNSMDVQGESLLMGESRLQVDFVFYLDHPLDRYTYQGSLEPMPFRAFNPLFKNLMFIKLERGNIRQANFRVDANVNSAQGNMRFLYQNLKMQLLDKEDPDDPGFKLQAASWLLNNLVIKSNNPGHFGNFRPGEIEAERDHQKSVFNHMSGAMISGMTSSLMPTIIEKLVNSLVGLP
ncbi:AsmA family protein [Cesiribacter andamanensis]|uniref:Uncharacterized protein n=1 Tax=Cesiribacter andamanensis AMV16 TaxID=1279009 RepID=M7N7R8_9BACT|nr:hypothetical protein [Cesiribacter andamanensis]EMR03282.1 hypothetical protein ADICEAN_01601 [Cesiribacter andamanensis AMV16]